jgi:hypothetical protein
VRVLGQRCIGLFENIRLGQLGLLSSLTLR